MPVSLAETRERDLPSALALESDPDVASWITVWPVERHRQAIASSDEAHLTVRADGASVGFVLLAGLLGPHDSIELRRIAVARRECGLGRATLAAALAHAFERGGAHRVWLDVMLDNKRARGLYASAGFVEEGVMREAHRIGRRYVPLCLMSILREEWAARTATPAGKAG
jgi:diamine N-acetyltransferase